MIKLAAWKLLNQLELWVFLPSSGPTLKAPAVMVVFWYAVHDGQPTQRCKSSTQPDRGEGLVTAQGRRCEAGSEPSGAHFEDDGSIWFFESFIRGMSRSRKTRSPCPNAVVSLIPNVRS